MGPVHHILTAARAIGQPDRPRPASLHARNVSRSCMLQSSPLSGCHRSAPSVRWRAIPGSRSSGGSVPYGGQNSILCVWAGADPSLPRGPAITRFFSASQDPRLGGGDERPRGHRGSKGTAHPAHTPRKGPGPAGHQESGCLGNLWTSGRGGGYSKRAAQLPQAPKLWWTSANGSCIARWRLMPQRTLAAQSRAQSLQTFNRRSTGPPVICEREVDFLGDHKYQASRTTP